MTVGVYELLFVARGTFLLVFYWSVNLHTGLRYMQIVVWERVREINEDLAMKIIFLSVYSVGLLVSFMTGMTRQFFSILLETQGGEKSFTLFGSDCNELLHPLELR